jgi:hypothetical protein
MVYPRRLRTEYLCAHDVGLGIVAGKHYTRRVGLTNQPQRL